MESSAMGDVCSVEESHTPHVRVEPEGNASMEIGINTYVISNRQSDDTIGELQFMYAANAPGQRYSDRVTDFQTTKMADWQTRLAADLFTICGGRPLHVIVNFAIHGFNNSAQDALTGAALYGNGMYAQGMTYGIVVALSWPSLCTLPSSGRA